ncbi:MAG: hypothetical protein Q9226_006229, partial [Calogaya cf. arnoldii]
NNVIVLDPTHQADSPAIIISGTTYTLPSSGISVLLPGSASPVPLIHDSENKVPPAEDNTQAITISGTTYTKSPTGTEVYINGLPLPPDMHATALVPSALIVAGQTLFPGQVRSVSGHMISLPATNTGQIVVDGERQSIMQTGPSGNKLAGGFIITDAQGSITASLIAAATFAAGGNITARISNSAESDSSVTSEGSLTSEQTGTSTYSGPTDGTAAVGQGAESLGIRERRPHAWLVAWGLGLGTFLPFALGL